MGWFDWALPRSRTGLSSLRDEAADASSPKASIPSADSVPATSPAILLALSLTEPATRGEWVRDFKSTPHSWSTVYTNPQRNLKVSKAYGLYGYDHFYTPFTLSKAEERLVREATTAFDKHLSDEKEREALARLVAPAIAIEVAEPARRAAARPKAKARVRKDIAPEQSA